MDGPSGSRVLGATSDLVELLRLAQSSVERIAQEVYGASYEHAELLERELQRLRRSAEKLQASVEEHVAHEEGKTAERGYPLRRAGDSRHN